MKDCPKNKQLAEKRGFEWKCENFRKILQPRALSSDISASRKGVYLFYNPPNDFSRPTHLDRSCIFCGFFVFLCAELSTSLLISPSLASAKSIFCFPWPIESLAWTLARFLACIPSKYNRATDVKSDGGLSKKQYQNNHSHQPRQEQTARWANQNFRQSFQNCPDKILLAVTSLLIATKSLIWLSHTNWKRQDLLSAVQCHNPAHISRKMKALLSPGLWCMRPRTQKQPQVNKELCRVLDNVK